MYAYHSLMVFYLSFFRLRKLQLGQELVQPVELCSEPVIDKEEDWDLDEEWEEW